MATNLESTIASTPKPSPINTVERDITWIKGHAIVALLAITLIVGSIVGGVDIFESLIEQHDARVAASQLAKEGVDTASQQALLTQLQQMQTANAARDAQQAALIQTLVQQMAQQRAQTAKQIVTDGTLTAQAAAARLVQQTKASPTDVSVSNDTVSMTLPLTRIVVADLDLLPQAQADVNNLQSQLDAQKILTSDAKVEASDAQKVIDADKTELLATIKADNAACNDRVAAQVKKDFKRSFWTTLGGFIGGIVLGSRL